jgi:hypothetical protein
LAARNGKAPATDCRVNFVNPSYASMAPTVKRFGFTARRFVYGDDLNPKRIVTLPTC